MQDLLVGETVFDLKFFFSLKKKKKSNHCLQLQSASPDQGFGSWL